MFRALAGRPVDAPSEANAPAAPPPPSIAGDDQDAGAGMHPVAVIDEDAGTGPDPGLDPTVKFTWKESLPGQGMCTAGRYLGKFRCTLQGDGVDDPAPMFSGLLLFGLVASQEEAKLTMTRFSNITYATSVAVLTGQLDCAHNQFTANSVGSVLTLGDVFVSYPNFDVELTGDFDPQKVLFTGKVTLHNDMNQSCVGTFSAWSSP